jgi:hypothetical protein
MISTSVCSAVIGITHQLSALASKDDRKDGIQSQRIIRTIDQVLFVVSAHQPQILTTPALHRPTNSRRATVIIATDRSINLLNHDRI